MEVTATATVRTWDEEQGWGVLDSTATPGGCWTHFSTLDLEGYRTLSPGQQVVLTAESPGQDGYPWRAVRVHGDRPAASGSSDQDPEGAYATELVITWDDEP